MRGEESDNNGSYMLQQVATLHSLLHIQLVLVTLCKSYQLNTNDKDLCGNDTDLYVKGHLSYEISLQPHCLPKQSLKDKKSCISAITLHEQ